MIACPGSGAEGDGASVRDLILESLAAAPFKLKRRHLRQRLAATGGDGAVVKGGIAARHQSTKAADFLWSAIHPQINLNFSYWDLFHRLGIADLRAVRAGTLSKEVIDIHKIMNALFGIGKGKIILRTVASEFGCRGGTPSTNPVTREGVYAASNAEDLVKYYKLYHTSLKVRVELARHGSGTRSQGSLTEIGRRFTAVDFVSFLVTFHDVNQTIVQPLNLIGQRVGEEGPETERAMQRTVHKLRSFENLLQVVRTFLWISVLILPHLDIPTVGRMWRALRYRPDLRRLPTLMAALPDLLFRCEFQGCALLETFHHRGGIDDSAYRLLSARCQCATNRTKRCACAFQPCERARCGRRRRFPVTIRCNGQSREVLAPHWVAFGPVVAREHSGRLTSPTFSWLEKLPGFQDRCSETHKLSQQWEPLEQTKN